MSHRLRAVLQPRAEIILLQEAGTGELTGGIWDGWEGQERLVCLRLGSLFPADGDAAHCRPHSALWPGVTPSAAAQIQINILILLNVSLLWRKVRRNINKGASIFLITPSLVYQRLWVILFTNFLSPIYQLQSWKYYRHYSLPFSQQTNKPGRAEMIEGDRLSSQQKTKTSSIVRTLAASKRTCC